MERTGQLPLKKPLTGEKTTVVKKGHLSKMEGPLFVFVKKKNIHSSVLKKKLKKKNNCTHQQQKVYQL